MHQHIFLKSTLRQPVRTVFLLLLIGVLSFAFTLRAGEYQLIRQRSERIGSYYRAIRELKWDGGEENPDVQAAVDYLNHSPYVKTVNLGAETSGVIQDGLSNVNYTYSLPSDQDPTSAVSNFNVFFYGEFLYSGRQGNQYGFVFRVDEVLGAYPEYLEPGKEVILSGTTLGHIRAGLVEGHRYLLRGYYSFSLDYNYQNRYFLLDSPKPEKQAYGIYEMMPLWENGDMYLEAPENLDLNLEPAIAQALYLVEENRKAVHVYAYMDVSASRWMQESDRTFYLAEGRWPDREDNDAGRRVCAIHRDLAELRGLQVGDTLTLKLRNVDELLYFGNCPDADPERYAALKTQTEAFEIVGIFGEIAEQPVHFNEVYIPLSAYPDSFPANFHLTTYTYTHYYTTGGTAISSDSTTERSAGTFVLNAPEEEAVFLAETEAELAALGFRADFLENGWDAFQAAVTPMKASALSGTLLFAGILTVALCLAGFLFFRFRRKELAISRALGVPAGTCIRTILLPLALVGSIGILAGCLAAWGYISSHAGQLLQAFAEFDSKETASGLSLGYLSLLFAEQFSLLLVIGSLFAVPMANRPVLALLQGGSQKRTRTAKLEPAPVNPPRGDTPTAVPAEPRGKPVAQPAAARKPGPASLLRFAGRCVRRCPGKSLLIAVLAAAFLVGLMFLQVATVRNETELNTLYDTVAVDLDIVKAYSTTGSDNDRGFLYQSTLDSVLASGFVSGCYLESEIAAEDVRQVDAQTGYILERPDESTGLTETLPASVQSFSDPERFFSDGLNSTYQITWLDGWDESIFTRELPDVLPAVVPKALYDSMNAQESGMIAVLMSTQDGVAIGKFTVAGTSEGGLGRILAPLWVMQALMEDSMTYYKATFSIDPAKNKELDTFRQALEAIISAPKAGTVPLAAVLWDQELTQAVKPMERVISFMRTLYPIVVILSALASAGVTILVTITFAKDAAIFRVLGSSCRRTQVMLWLQTVPLCLAGLVMGHVEARLLAYGSLGTGAKALMLPALGCAALYLAAAALAAISCAKAMTAKNPLQLLQVKE